MSSFHINQKRHIVLKDKTNTQFGLSTENLKMKVKVASIGSHTFTLPR